jgi:hypothetical protein
MLGFSHYRAHSLNRWYQDREQITVTTPRHALALEVKGID